MDNPERFRQDVQIAWEESKLEQICLVVPRHSLSLK